MPTRCTAVAWPLSLASQPAACRSRVAARLPPLRDGRDQRVIKHSFLRPSKVDQCTYSDFVCEIVDRRVVDTLLSLTGRMWRGRLAVGWILTGPEQEHIRIRSKAYNAIDGGP